MLITYEIPELTHCGCMYVSMSKYIHIRMVFITQRTSLKRGAHFPPQIPTNLFCISFILFQTRETKLDNKTYLDFVRLVIQIRLSGFIICVCVCECLCVCVCVSLSVCVCVYYYYLLIYVTMLSGLIPVF